jgi:hypothetical protein
MGKPRLLVIPSNVYDRSLLNIAPPHTLIVTNTHQTLSLFFSETKLDGLYLNEITALYFLSISTAYATESFVLPRKMKGYFAIFTIAVTGVAAGHGYNNADTHYEGEIDR